MGKRRLCEYDLFFLSYDEPLRESRWELISSAYPKAQWVDGVKGFDRSLKVCAEKANSERFVVIDGDNVLLSSFADEIVSEDLDSSNYVLSWSSINSINGLEYGNGGVKCWTKTLAYQMKTHEASENRKGQTDFCFEVPYYQFSKSLTRTEVHLTPFQAFRAGFREGVKMAFLEGLPPSPKDLTKDFKQLLPKGNLFRLLAWMTLGLEVPNGIWGIYGARLGFANLLAQTLDLRLFQNYDIFDQFWKNEIAPMFVGTDQSCVITNYQWDMKSLIRKTEELGFDIFDGSQLITPLYLPKNSKILKSQLQNPVREGLMLKGT